MTTPTKTTCFDFNNMTQQILMKLPELLDYFGIKYTKYKNRLAFSCPIHNSDGMESACIFTSGDSGGGNFVCWTQHCECEIGLSCIKFFQYLVKKKMVTYTHYSNSLISILRLSIENKQKYTHSINLLTLILI